jgi:hypothetical protein
MANTKPKKLQAAFTMRTDGEFLAKLDDLRATERPVKTRADMLRTLVEDRWRSAEKPRRK